MERRAQVDLEEEIRESQRAIQPHCDTLAAEERAMCGKFYGENLSDAEIPDDPENARLTFARNILAEVGTGTPQVIIDPRGVEWPADRAYLIESSVNETFVENRLHRFTNQTIVDFCLRSARAVCSLKKTGDTWRGDVRRLAFDEFLCDSTVSDRDHARWKAHRVAKDIDTVIEDAEEDPSLGWDLDVLRKLKDALDRDPRAAAKQPSGAKRRELVYWPMWWPGDQTGDPRKGFNGTIYYAIDPEISAIAGITDGVVRKPHPWFGPEFGPYPFAAGFKIGDLHVELSPLVASASPANWLNDISRALKDGVQRFKSNTVVNGDELSAVIRASRNGDTITVPVGDTDVRAKVINVTSGGMSPDMLVAFQHFFESLQRSLGVYSRLGDVEASATATAIQSADAGYASTVGLYADSYRQFQAQIGATWAYWADLDSKVKRRIGPLPDDIVAALLERGVEIDLEQGPFVDLEGSLGDPAHHRNLGLAIDAFAARSKNEIALAQDIAVATSSAQFLTSLGPNILAFDVDEFQRNVSKARGARWIGKLWDANKLRAVAGLMLQMQQEPEPPQSTAQSTQKLNYQGGSSSPSKPAQGARANADVRKPEGPMKQVAAGAAKAKPATAGATR